MFGLIRKSKSDRLIEDYVKIDNNNLELITILKEEVSNLQKENENLKNQIKEQLEIITSQPEYELVSLSIEKTIHKNEVKEFPEIDLIGQLIEEGKEELVESLKQEFEIEESSEFNIENRTISFNYYKQVNK